MPYGPDGRWTAPVHSLGYQVVDWIEAYLVHGPGDVQGQPIVIDREYARFIVDAYAVDSKGRRVVNRAFLSRPKGRAKSELAGMLVCAEALGPVRCDGFDANGVPVGKPVTYPFIRCLATEESQAGNTYDNVYYMLTEGPVVDAYAGLDVNLGAVNLPGGGKIVPSTASSSSKDGGKESFAVFDESHLYTLPELHRMYDTVTRNLLKRKLAEPWALETSTMYAPGEGSIAEKTHSDYLKVAEGLLDSPGLLFDHKEAPQVSLKNKAELKKALKYVYGPAADWMDLDRMVVDLQTMQEHEARRYFLNQPTATADQWMLKESWENAASSERPQPGDQIAIGFDGSLRYDATAIIGCRLSDGLVFPIKIWENPHTSEDWEVDVLAVDAAMAEAFKLYRVEWVYADPAYWQDIVGRWALEFGDNHVFEFWTHRDTPMANAVERFRTGVDTNQISHVGDKTLTRHVYNARNREVRAGTVLRKETKRSKNHIDACMAAVLAVEARADALADGRMRVRRFRAMSY
ncbi:terminase TerL endonuclease subunit [Streptosporangium sp. OZ121]|uniref:terminase TerL endonuclease subunit n=1 Tax=Streptosporangium sp. OZ121 TaxID=3444183 RepID=UPI003F795AC7